MTGAERGDIIALLVGLGLLDSTGRPFLSPTNGAGSTATAATAGAHGAVPAQVDSYLVLNVNGQQRKLPLYLP